VTKPVQESTLLNRIQLALSGSRSRTVLVADDDPDILNLLSHLLRNDGYDVITAVNGREAVDLTRRECPAVVLLDIRMPELNGVEALREIRSDAATMFTPVIMMTASPGLMEEHRSAIELLGASTLLSKPHSAEELAEVLAALAATPAHAP